MVFVGRATEVAAFENALTDRDTSGANIFGHYAAVQGMGGIGKTSLAIVLGHRLQNRYPDVQLFLNLRAAGDNRETDGGAIKVTPVTPAEAMRTVIQSFKPDGQLPETLAQLTPIYRSVLAEAGAVLLVLDNVANAEQVQSLLPPPNCLLLVTSRTQFQLPGLVARTLDYLSPEKSRELLLALSPRLKGFEFVAADLCGHLPLALQVFAHAINDKTLTPVNELIQRLREGKERLAPVDAAFEVSYGLLDQELRRKWTLLAVFPGNFDLSAAAAVWEKSHEAQLSTVDLSEARDAMQELFNASLVEWNESNGRFRLHDLVRQFCDSKLSNGDRDAAQLRHAQHYRDVSDRAAELLRHGSNKPEDIQEFVVISNRERVNLEAGINSLWKRRDRESNVVLFALLKHSSGTIERAQRQIEAARIAEDRYAEALAFHNLARVYRSNFTIPKKTRHEKAVEFFKHAISLHSEFDDKSLKAETLYEYAMALMVMGNKKEAIAPAEKGAAIFEEINRPGMARQLRGVANQCRSSPSSSGT